MSKNGEAVPYELDGIAGFDTEKKDIESLSLTMLLLIYAHAKPI